MMHANTRASLLALTVALTGCTRLPPTASGTDADADADVDADADTDADTDTEPPTPAETVRIVTWNIESVGATGSAELDATRAVLARIDADIVALNEVDWYEQDELAALADDLGYDTVISPDDNPFGSLHNAILTRLPVLSSKVWTSSDLSGDRSANDLTRLPVSVEVETPGGEPLTVVSQHWKSGFETVDEFRRVIDGIRVAQAARSASSGAVVALGDVNAELDDVLQISSWSYVPSDVPVGYVLGSDLAPRLDLEGIPNDVFLPMDEAGLEVVDARQMDGRFATRDSSGRRLDHIFADAGLRISGAEVYDARDEPLGGLPKSGTEPERTATELASDHFPVFVDLAP